MLDVYNIAAFGDIHIERLKRWFKKDWADFQFNTIERNLKSARRKGVTQIIQLGDLFHSANPNERTVLRLVDLISKHRMHWTIIPGNHDRPLLDNHSMDILLWIAKKQAAPITVVMEPGLHDINSFKVWVCPHPYVESPPKKTHFDFAMGHYPRTGAKRDNGTVEKDGHSPKGLWILGDFHQYQRGRNFIYAGTLMQTEFHESLTKGFLHITLNKTSGKIKVNLVPVRPGYKLHSVVCKHPEDLKALKNAPHFYSLKVPRDFEFPDGWQELYPNIMQHSIEGDEKVVKDLETALQLSDDPFEGIEDYVKVQYGLSPRMMKWGLNKLVELRNTGD